MEIGFRASDKSTWKLPSSKEFVKVDCKEIKFDSAEQLLITQYLAPLLVGAKQAFKPEKRDVVINAVAYFLRYVRCCDIEISTTALPKILEEFPIKLKSHDKQSMFFKLLREWNWLYVRVEYFHPKQIGKSGRGRARAYGIGKAMVKKFGSSPSNSPPTQNRSIYMSPTFCDDEEIERIIQPFDLISRKKLLSDDGSEVFADVPTHFVG